MAGETETTAPDGASNVPESIDVAQAVGLMGDLADGDNESEGNEERDPASPEPSEAEGEGGEATQDADEEAADADIEADESPEFWSAEDKAAWQGVPAELRPLLKKYEQQRLSFVNEKVREAATVRAQAAEEVQRANATVDQAAQWWQQAGPALQQAFADKWSQVNWTELAEKNPAEWTRLNQVRMDEAAVLAEANRRGQADVQAANARAEQAFQHARRAEHAKLAQRLPDYFGAPETAAKTYDELGKYLFAKGIPADRINAIHEAPIIELALNAMRFEQAQNHVLRSRRSGEAGTTARPTPTRVAPGPANRAGNRTADAARQVGERFRKSGGSSIADAAELIRLNGL